MDLTFALLLLLPLFLLPCILLPLNKVRVYFIGSLSAFIPVAFLYMINRWIDGIFIEQTIGKSFLPVFGFLFVREELSTTEINHLSFSFFLLVLYLATYFLVYLFTKRFYVGNNPTFHKQLNRIQKVILSIFFFITSYTVASVFLINIREILPFPDGLFANLFSWIYQIEA